MTNFLNWWNVRKVAVLFLVAGFLSAMGGSLYEGSGFEQIVPTFYSNVSTEFISIAVTVLIIDALYQRRASLDELDRLMRELGSKHPGVAMTAADHLRANGWLEDGSMRGALLREANLESAILWEVNLQEGFLDHANLQDADLTEANLQAADLNGANLERAHLMNANLQGAYLSRANLQRADLLYANLESAEMWTAEQLAAAGRLRGAILPDGSLYESDSELAREIRKLRGELEADEEGEEN